MLDAGLAQILSPTELLAHLLQTLRDFPGRAVRLESVVRAGFEESYAVATQL